MNGKNSSFDTLIATAGVSGLDGDGSSGTNGGDIDSKKVGPFKGKNAGGGAGGEAVKVLVALSQISQQIHILSGDTNGAMVTLQEKD